MEFETITVYVKYYLYVYRWDGTKNSIGEIDTYGPFLNEESAKFTVESYGFTKGDKFYEKGKDFAHIERRLEEEL